MIYLIVVLLAVGILFLFEINGSLKEGRSDREVVIKLLSRTERQIRRTNRLLLGFPEARRQYLELYREWLSVQLETNPNELGRADLERIEGLLRETYGSMPEANKKWWNEGQTLETFGEWGTHKEE